MYSKVIQLYIGNLVLKWEFSMIDWREIAHKNEDVPSSSSLSGRSIYEDSVFADKKMLWLCDF